MDKAYEKGMTDGSKGDSLTRNSRWVLTNKQPAEAMSGNTSTGRFIPVSLADTSPTNQTALNNEGDANE